MPSNPKHILITGAAGWIGREIIPELHAAGHRIRGLDRVPLDPNNPNHTPIIEACDDYHVADLTDLDAMHAAVRDIDTIIHLAGYVHGHGDFLQDILQPNIVGLHQLTTAAIASRSTDRSNAGRGVQRLILASTLQTVSGHKPNPHSNPDHSEPITTDIRKPTNYYALSKIWAEQLGEMLHRLHGLEVICPRIGWFVRNADEAAHLDRIQAYDSYLSHSDCRHFFRRCVEAKNVTYAVLNAVSQSRNPITPRFDLDYAKYKIQYVPKQSWSNKST